MVDRSFVRDPSYLGLNSDNAAGHVILADDGPRTIDFGIAKGADTIALTVANAVTGTLRFMSPEQLHGHELTGESDAFALGAILAYAATGHDPFEAPTVPAVINHILNEPPSLDPLAGDLRDIISDCLARNLATAQAQANSSPASILRRHPAVAG